MTPGGAAYHVGVSGSYGGLNLGDEAILEGIIKERRGSLPVEITVFTRDAADTRRRHRVEQAVAVREFLRRRPPPRAARQTPRVDRMAS